MASRRGLTRARLGVAAVVMLLLAAIGYGLTTTPFLDEEAIRAEIAARLSDWAGRPVELSGPFRLHYFPTPYLTTGGLSLEAAPNLPRLRSLNTGRATVDLGLWSLMSAQPVIHRVTLLEPRIALQMQPPASEGDAAQAASPLVRALRTMPVPELRFLDGTLTVSGPDTSERISQLNLGIDISLPQGNVEGDGDLQWRGEELSFTFTGTAPPPEAEGASFPLSVSVNAPLVSAEMSAKGSIADGVRATGTLDLEIADLRRFMRWLGLMVPEGRGLETFRASGAFNWYGRRFAFDEGTFALDGNRALGTLALDLGGPRPSIEGTLAFSTFDLAQYRASGKEPKPEEETAGKPNGTPQSVSAGFPMLNHFDIDLRLSTNEVVAPPLRLGQVALSATAKAGRLTADFAILDICGGNGSGRFILDAAAPQARKQLTANMTGLAARPCLEAFMPRSPLSGELGLSAELSSKGRTAEAILRHLDGTVRADIGPGEIGIDLTALKTPAQNGTAGDWKALTAGTTSFSSATTELTFREGTIFSDSLEIVSGETLYSGEGTIGLSGRIIDLRILSRRASAQGGSGETTPREDPATVAELSGPWSAPRIRVRAPGAETQAE